MLGAAMRHRLLALCLSLLLLLTQQLGQLHLLSHGLQPPAQTDVQALDRADPGHSADVAAGDALCQVCLVLATLGAAGLPAVWRWLAGRASATEPLAPPRPAPARLAAVPFQARAPPALPAMH
jgi:hypothetical protein